MYFFFWFGKTKKKNEIFIVEYFLWIFDLLVCQYRLFIFSIIQVFDFI